MSFWDSSSIVPALIEESDTAEVRELIRGGDRLVVSWATRVECLSALARRERDGFLSHREVDQARRTLDAMIRAWDEIPPSDEVRELAGALLFRHPLRAGDALQLGAALAWCDSRPADYSFCTLDNRLAEAARREGFELLLRS